MKHTHLRLSAILAFVLACGLLLFVLGPASADVDDSYSSALLHMNGADASTTFTDESTKTWTAHGDAQIDTAQSKFGGASGLFDTLGTGGAIDTDDSADFDVGSGEFTFDFWMKSNVNSADRYIYTQGDGTVGGTAIQIKLTSTNRLDTILFWGTGSSYYEVLSTGTILVASGWVHIAGVRSGNTFTQYINGAADGTQSLTGKTINNGAGKPTLGWLTSSAYFFNGWIDEFRYSKGIARWTTNFTPPTSEYPDRTLQTQTAAAATSTAAYVGTSTASAATSTAAYDQTNTAVAMTATAANNLTQTAIAGNVQTQIGVVQTWIAGHDQTQIAALSATPTNTGTATTTPTFNPAPQFESTISYGDLARTNALMCLATIGGLFALVWIVVTFGHRRQRP